MGGPMRPLLWVSKSHEKLAAALRELGYKIQKSSIPKLLGLLKYPGHVARLEQRNAYLESELKIQGQHHANALKENIVLKQQLATTKPAKRR
jgi:hypothetical protein